MSFFRSVDVKSTADIKLGLSVHLKHNAEPYDGEPVCLLMIFINFKEKDYLFYEGKGQRCREIGNNWVCSSNFARVWSFD